MPPDIAIPSGVRIRLRSKMTYLFGHTTGAFCVTSALKHAEMTLSSLSLFRWLAAVSRLVSLLSARHRYQSLHVSTAVIVSVCAQQMPCNSKPNSISDRPQTVIRRAKYRLIPYALTAELAARLKYTLMTTKSSLSRPLATIPLRQATYALRAGLGGNMCSHRPVGHRLQPRNSFCLLIGVTS